jgi:DNA-directed RNA polymerase sigma subunit (sigma70/sigma32)
LQNLVGRHGIGGAPERTPRQIARELGIRKEHVRPIMARAQAKSRELARREALEAPEL